MHAKLNPALQRHRYSLLFLGAPGVGKGTFGKVIAPYFNAQLMTSSDLLRDAADEQLKSSDSEAKANGEYIKECIRTGKLVRDELVIPIVCEFLHNCSGSFIFDGFPRTINQAQQLQAKYPLDLGIYFKLPHHLLVNKMLGRRVCVNHDCNSSYNVTEINEGDIVMPSMKPKKDGVCDHCGSELEIRIDDTMEVIEERLRIFYEQNIPIVEFYKASGLLVEWDVKKGVDDIPDILSKIERKLLTTGKAKKQASLDLNNHHNHKKDTSHAHP
eukprot:CAMPEP_0197058040 /NCGR_PEP_ID=MMETSP1384-20130603/103327_1 /TAXON_ID=29189 /ORGANISM="Ammonia sp." /LENGTH=270 /DNA_ID=CAMNT_0042492649 /DNA_START=218 /DNA_END=1030 /DNA_ORIENTATION=+